MGSSLLDQKRSVLNTEDVPLTVDVVKAVMPKRQKHNINQKLVDELNLLVDEPEARDNFRENLIGYASVLMDKNVTLPGYVQAVKYVSYKLMGFTNQQSWIKTFPERYQRLIDDKKDALFIRSTVACYNRGQTVNKIIEQTLIPTYVLNQDIHQKAINVQAELMFTATSEKVRTDAANSLLTHLKQPESTKVSLDITVKEDDSIRELRETTMELVRQQRLMIGSKAMNAKEVAEGKIITGDFERVDNV